MIRLAIRFDDPSPMTSRPLEEAILGALDRHGVRATFALVPFGRDGDRALPFSSRGASHLVQAARQGAIEIALHGHSHRAQQKVNGKPSEFVGLSVVRQSELIDEGSRCLRELFGADAVQGFVPPFNGYDLGTLQALAPRGFRYISAGEMHPSDYRGPLAVLPRTCQLVDIESALAEARRYAAFRTHVVAVLHHYDFRESGSEKARMDLDELGERLAWIRAQPDVAVMTLREMVAADSARVLVRHARPSVLREHLPWRLRQRLPRRCLVDASLWRLLLAR